MIARLWFVLSIVWALCVLLPNPASTWSNPEMAKKLLLEAFAPFILGIALKLTTRYIISGSFRPQPWRRFSR